MNPFGTMDFGKAKPQPAEKPTVRKSQTVQKSETFGGPPRGPKPTTIPNDPLVNAAIREWGPATVKVTIIETGASARLKVPPAHATARCTRHVADPRDEQPKPTVKNPYF